MRDRLNEEIGALERTPQGPLAERVQIADERRQLDDRLSQLNIQFAKLGRLRADIAALFANFNRALDVLSVETADEGVASIGFTPARAASPATAGPATTQDIDGRVAELAAFIEATQFRLDEIERKAVAFAQMKTKLGDLQSRLLPLEAADGGVANLIAKLKDIRDQLLARIRQIEEDDEGDLAARVTKVQRDQAGTGKTRLGPQRAICQAGDDPQGYPRLVREVEQHHQRVVKLTWSTFASPC